MQNTDRTWTGQIYVLVGFLKKTCSCTTKKTLAGEFMLKKDSTMMEILALKKIIEELKTNKKTKSKLKRFSLTKIF